ncbi:unnamed protein product [Orchesella dallaii]|uniref:Uncharacterized protein n=1 Tax=Orchesella dallaii TaxID=48710 RepID=A0ABP1RYM0_9HEXA
MSYPTQPDFPEMFQPQPSLTQNQYQPGVYLPVFPTSTVPYNNQYMGPPLPFAGGVGQVGGITTTQRRYAVTSATVMCLLMILPFVLIGGTFLIIFFTYILPMERKAGRL